MGLFRLDYVDPERPVRDPIIGGDLITRHMTTARKRATEIAAESGESILISRIGNAGELKPSIVIGPDGVGKRPPGSKPVSEREDCKRETGQACFCSACRAERKAARRG